MPACWKVVATALLAALSVAACASPAATTGREYEQFEFSCCAAASLDAAWHPGDDIALRWIVKDTGTTTDAAGSPITLTAALSGPFASVAALKAGAPLAGTLTATPLYLDDRNPGAPVSSIALPGNLAAGWYDLVYSVNAGSGNRVGGATVIRVTSSSH